MDAPNPFASASDLAAGVASRAFSSREVTELYIRRIERHNAALNAVVTLDAEAALAAADKADEAIVRGAAIGPLHGLPLTIKDCFETAGLRTTSGATQLADYVPERDAEAVARLRGAGAIVMGKTNLPTFAGDSQTFNELFGVTNNPWDLSRTPGGSSGGAAAAVAAGLSALELGSDIGGSLRIPAHFCGLFTIKPTFGIISLKGHIPPPPGVLSETDVCVAGPIARSAADLDLALSLLAGPDRERAVAWRLELPPPRRTSLRDYRIAALLDDPYSSVDREIARIHRQLVEELRTAGARIDEAARPPSLAEGHEVAQRLIGGAASGWPSDEEYAALIERAVAAPADDQSPPVRWARNATQRVRDFGVVTEQRLQLKAAWATFFRDYDALLTPAMPNVAIPHDHNPDVDARTITVNGETRAYGDQYAWLQSIGVVHLPAVVAPVGLTAAGLPVGVQIVGPHLEDRTPIDIAARIAEVTGGFQPPPGY